MMGRPCTWWTQLPEQKSQSWPFWLGILWLVGVVNTAGRAGEVGGEEQPLGSLHGLRRVDGLSGLPETLAVSQAFPFGCGEWEVSPPLLFLSCFLVLVRAGPAVGSRTRRGFWVWLQWAKRGAPFLPCL